MLDNFRKSVGNYFLRRDLAASNRKHIMMNLQNAKQIGILYPLNDVPDYEKVSEFVTQLQQERKEVKALGFVKSKNLVARFLPKLSYDFFSFRDLTWFYKPVHARVRDFIEKDFDLLIDLSMTENLPLKYIAGISHALCRVGRFSDENMNCYDVMIHLKAATSIDEYIGQIKHYLNVIKTNEPSRK